VFPQKKTVYEVTTKLQGAQCSQEAWDSYKTQMECESRIQLAMSTDHRTWLSS
jgi:hypothetical protein